MMTDKRAESWMGFACKKCGAPLAIEQSMMHRSPANIRREAGV